MVLQLTRRPGQVYIYYNMDRSFEPLFVFRKGDRIVYAETDPSLHIQSSRHAIIQGFEKFQTSFLDVLNKTTYNTVM